MILADKIVMLRKKEGWSQEQLAERVGVSRQAISKWESVQSTPDMKKILKLAEVFGVSTDYLLKDDLEEPQAPEGGTWDEGIDEKGEPLTPVSMEEANAYLAQARQNAVRIALGVMLCILSPVAIILLGGLADASTASGDGWFFLVADSRAEMLGTAILLTLIAVAVGLFVSSGIRSSKFEYLEKVGIDTAYGVEAMVKERKERFEPQYVRELTTGIILCIASVIPVAAASVLAGGREDTAPEIVCTALLLVIVAFGVFLIVHACTINGSYNVLLEQGDYTRERKQTRGHFSGYYWAVVTAAYLAVSFLTNAWGRTWMIWVAAAVLYGVFEALFRRFWKR